MGSQKQKKATIPPAAAPIPDPVPIDVEVLEKERSRRAQRLSKFGRAGTILTMGGLGNSESGQGSILGMKGAA